MLPCSDHRRTVPRYTDGLKHPLNVEFSACRKEIRSPGSPPMEWMYSASWIRRCVAGLILFATSSQLSLGQAELAFEFGRNSQGDNTVEFRWLAEANIVLQRSSTLRDNEWETLLATRGETEFSAIRQSAGPMFYRLVSLPDSTSLETTPAALEWRLTEMTINQIDRAVNPQSTLGERQPVPPDDGDGQHSIDLSGELEPFTWASQPGLIRVYNPGKAGFHRAYKLYSSKDSVASSSEDLQADIATTRTWQSHSDRFTNLNEPISEANGNKRFPILDPRALGLGVEGFDYFDDSTLGTAVNTALPMPAEWFYTLKDGSLGTLDDDGAWTGEGGASETNPIVARLAYWGDDETAKLNVNVASEGVPWDVPRADTPQERAYALTQPVNGEVQRYPGHPSMTSLSSILFPGKSVNHEEVSLRLSTPELELIYQLTPRVVYKEMQRDTPLTLDSDTKHINVADWLNKAKSRRSEDAETLRGFVTTSNPAPEISIHGLPRVSMWPVHESDSLRHRTAYDAHSAALSPSYGFLRRDSNSRHTEFYSRSNRHNVDLFQYLMHQTYMKTPGYGKSLAAKYGARLSSSDYQDDTDYDKDHFMIAFSMLDHIRTTNIFDPNQGAPYVDPLITSGSGLGTMPGLSLISRDLKTGNGTSDHAQRWSQRTLEPSAAGRDYTLSELVLTAYITGETTIKSWSDGQPSFTSEAGPSSDSRVRHSIIENKHPAYTEWTGHRFGPNDVGKTFVSIEVGLIPEAFSPSQGAPRKLPNQTLRLLTGGSGYRGGLSSSRGLRVNGVPLQLWGESIQTNTSLQGPILSTAERPELLTRLQDIPRDWPSHGGLGGPRLFSFGRFTIAENQEGWFGNEFLANGTGPLSAWYSQTLVIIEKATPLSFTQEEPIQIALYAGGPESASPCNITRLFNFRFAQPGKSFEVPAPEGRSLQYSGWTRRLRGARQSSADAPSPITEPNNDEATKGLSVTHGDYRHVALKRVVPSELFGHHLSAKIRRNSHSLAWATRNGTSVEPSARQGPAEIGRSLVNGVTYADEILPDFAHDSRNRAKFAPLLSSNYRFPIDPTITRDFDNGLGNAPDGPYINTSDDGEDRIQGTSIFNPLAPYFEGSSSIIDVFGHEHHFARRMAPSPVAFGSLPSAAQANAPWTCLLFRPNLSTSPHLGEAGNGMVWERNRTTLDAFEIPQMASVTGDPTYPADHLWLDYFWMPMAQPVDAASPFATQGKVNMNYQLFPYTYIKRATAMHAVLKGEEIMAIPTSAGPTYKSSQDNPNWRHRIDARETLTQFDLKFGKGEIFMTESEICEQFLIPEGQAWDGTGASMRAFWDAHRLSGDNTLERPYAGLYSRLTTRSNAFKLHFRIQAISKGTDSPPNRFDNDKDTILEDRRGSKVIERVLKHEDLPNYLDDSHDLATLPRAEAFYEVIVRDEE